MGFPKEIPVWLEAEPESMCLSDHGGDSKTMKKKMTFSLDDKLIWLLRNEQAKMMLELNQSVSISNVVDFFLNKAIKAENVINSELDSVFARPNGMHFQVDKI